MTSANCMSSADFFAAWKHSLSADFEQDGVPAKSDPWVTQAAKIATSDKALVLALSDDSALLAAAVGHEIHVYEIATSELLHTLRGHTGSKIERLEFQPGGRKIAAGSSRIITRQMTYMCRVWDLDALAESGAQDYLDEAVEAAVSAASSTLSQHWSPEDLEAADLQTKFAEIIAGGQVAVDLRNGLVFAGTLPGHGSRAFSHDGRSLLYISDRNHAVVLDVATLTERFRLSSHTDAIMWAEMSPDDKVIATSSWDKTTRIWSMESGELIHVLEGATNQSWVGAFSPDGALIASGSGDKIIRIWRVDTGELMHTLSGFTQWIRSLAFSPDGGHLVAGAAGGTLRVFDVASGACEQSWQVDLTDRFARSFIEIDGVRYTARGDLFFRSPEGRVFGYRASDNLKWESGKVLQYGQFATSKDGSLLVTPLQDHSVCIWKID
ncbi:WD40-repeat-containing domain protein [Mycena albidolilacea]|uniref:WD40-repeat-containing domain protein n=1 Tax=Mycena albidolilacea TaxID=1033008 RepID=A0AAD7EHC9_9AGAR|nr:WD40-repeat-containing domain protein [Mycena albidolilacea]